MKIRYFQKFRRMMSIIYLYAARLIIPSPTKRISTQRRKELPMKDKPEIIR
ncbi:MAG: hypothetical protein ACI4KR_13885 [Ruminiclostridium sp.]